MGDLLVDVYAAAVSRDEHLLFLVDRVLGVRGGELYRVAPDDAAVGAVDVQQARVGEDEAVVLNHHVAVIRALLAVVSRPAAGSYHRLAPRPCPVHAVGESVVADGYIARAGLFIPVVAVSLKQDGASGRVEPAVFYVYIFITFLIWCLGMTLADVPTQGIAAVLTPNPDERTNVVSIANTAKQVGFAACAVIVPMKD